MKLNELPNIATGQSIQLDAKGKDVILEIFPDGDIFFWTDDGMCMEFDRKNTALILAALRQQEKLPKTTRAVPAVPASPLRAPGAATAVSLRAAPARESGHPRTPNRSVAKEQQGWGATVVVGAQAVRYYYDKRDNAREADASHQIGEAGRVA
ncbi:MAG TPA: hypothetical protein VMV33_12395 [Rhodocyclaceae bacterium]|nr:hypothetical protein [Rhodocyclaceae bacterium]